MATHPVVFPGKSHGQRSLAGYSSRGHKRVRHDLVIQQQQSHIVVHLWRTGKVIKIQRGEKRKKTKKGRKTYYSHMNLVCPCDSISKLLEENFSSSGRKGGRKGRERKEREIREKRRKRKGKKKRNRKPAARLLSHLVSRASTQSKNCPIRTELLCSSTKQADVFMDTWDKNRH